VPEQSPVNVVPDEFNVTTVPFGNEYVHSTELGFDPAAESRKCLKEGEQKVLPEGKQCENGIDVDNGHIAMSQKKAL